MGAKVRLDAMMVERGLTPTLDSARSLIMAGVVVVGDHGALKAGELVDPAMEIRLKGDFNPYVSRGGLKLEAAIEGFGIDPSGRVCIDVGASTGGFTDCLLAHGAAKVYAVDVGYGQLAWKLREDPRVVVLERQNIRTMDPALVGEPADLVTVDASFISVTHFIEKIYALLKPSGEVIVLVKPQFEVERAQVGKGGVVRDPELRAGAVERVSTHAAQAGFVVLDSLESPVPGAKKGNIEFLVHLRKR